MTHLEFIYDVLLDVMLITTTKNTNICSFRSNPHTHKHTKLGWTANDAGNSLRHIQSGL
jgi:hypothetical protein